MLLQTPSVVNVVGQLEWKADFDAINQPKYTSHHCNQDYVIRIDTVKVEIGGGASKEEQGWGQEKSFLSTKEDEPKAIQMAEAMKRQQQQEEG